MDGKRLKGVLLAGAAAVALGAGATTAVGYGHANAGGQGSGPPEPQPGANQGQPGAAQPAQPGAAQPAQQRRGGRQVIAAWLDAEQEVPSPTGNVANASGKFQAQLNRRGADGMWVGNARLQYSGLTGPATAAHIHMGRLGTAGPIQVNLCGTADTPDCQSGLRTRLNLTNAQMGAIRRGNYYVNVHTAANPPGEIRGQLGLLYRVRANLTVGQERPRPVRPPRGATGRLIGELVRYGQQGHLDVRLTYRRLSGPATAAHIHTGARGRIGPVAIPLCGETGTPRCRTGLSDMYDVQGNVLRALLRGRTYVNVHTSRNPPGEIRGQVRAVLAR